MPAGAEAVEVFGARPQSGQFDVHAVRQFRCRNGDSALRDPGEPFVVGDLPFHVDGVAGMPP